MTANPSSRASAQPLDFSATARTGRAHLPFLRKHLTAAHSILRPPLAEFSLALVGDQTMAQLHEQFMGIPGPTDVLTFELDCDARGRVTSGEVVICVPEAKRQAAKTGVAVRNELLLYALHGMLHLCGFDDRTDSAYRTMHRKEDQILTTLGIGAVFRPAQQSPGAPEPTPTRAASNADSHRVRAVVRRRGAARRLAARALPAPAIPRRRATQGDA